jgi:hypothetical protein
MKAKPDKRTAKAYLIFENVRRVSDHVKHGAISFCHLVMSSP